MFGVIIMARRSNPFAQQGRPEHEEYMKARKIILSDFPSLKENFPYAAGTREEIIEHYKNKGEEIDERYISQVLRSYSIKDEYLESVIEKTHRFDVHGNHAGEIGAEAKAKAQKELKKRKKKRERRMLEKESQAEQDRETE